MLYATMKNSSVKNLVHARILNNVAMTWVMEMIKNLFKIQPMSIQNLNPNLLHVITLILSVVAVTNSRRKLFLEKVR